MKNESAFANTPNDAVKIISSDRIMTIITERLDESLVVASHYLGWSLADVVVTVHRKALSAHPKHTSWPKEAIATLQQTLIQYGEYDLYNAAAKKLNERILKLNENGVNVNNEVQILQNLRKRVTEVSFFVLSFFYIEYHYFSHNYNYHNNLIHCFITINIIINIIIINFFISFFFPTISSLLRYVYLKNTWKYIVFI